VQCGLESKLWVKAWVLHETCMVSKGQEVFFDAHRLGHLLLANWAHSLHLLQ
jgi:hypothetical protein